MTRSASSSARLRVGVGLLPVPLRNPALAAMEIATLARLFPDRLTMVLGHGVQVVDPDVVRRARELVADWVAELADAGADSVILQATEHAPDPRPLIDALT